MKKLMPQPKFQVAPTGLLQQYSGNSVNKAQAQTSVADLQKQVEYLNNALKQQSHVIHNLQLQLPNSKQKDNVKSTATETDLSVPTTSNWSSSPYHTFCPLNGEAVLDGTDILNNKIQFLLKQATDALQGNPKLSNQLWSESELNKLSKEGTKIKAKKLLTALKVAITEAVSSSNASPNSNRVGLGIILNIQPPSKQSRASKIARADSEATIEFDEENETIGKPIKDILERLERIF